MFFLVLKELIPNKDQLKRVVSSKWICCYSNLRYRLLVNVNRQGLSGCTAESSKIQ